MRTGVLLWWGFLSLLLLAAAFISAYAYIVVAAREVAWPTRGGISPSEVAAFHFLWTNISAVIGLLSLLALMVFWGQRRKRGDRLSITARVSLLFVPALLFLLMVGVFLALRPVRLPSSGPPGLVPTPTPVRQLLPTPSNSHSGECRLAHAPTNAHGGMEPKA